MLKGRIVNIVGNIFKVYAEDGKTYSIPARGKFRYVKVRSVNENSPSKKEENRYRELKIKVGDFVEIKDGRIEIIAERKNELIRPEIANVDQILLVFSAKEPTFSCYLLDMFIVNILRHRMKPCIVITKIDKCEPNELEDLRKTAKYYESLGYPVCLVDSLHQVGLDRVRKILEKKVTILSGQTGAGKSTLINALIPGFQLETQEISLALGRGKHTTRQTHLYAYADGWIGDTPGFSKLELHQISQRELRNYFVEFEQYPCRFKDCLHQSSAKDCGVRNAVIDGKILSSRYANYLKLLEDLKSKEW